MTTEEQILAKLSTIEAQLGTMVEARRKTEELKKDMTPLVNRAISNLINELMEVESSFELDDLIDLLKQLMRSTRNLTYVLKQLDNIIEFVKDMGPLMKSAVPILIGYLDDLEKRGVLRIIKSTLDIRAKVASAYDYKDIDEIGDGVVKLLGFSKNLADPVVAELIHKMLNALSTIELDKVKQVGPGGLVSSSFDPEVKKGLGVFMELTKALGRMESPSTVQGA